MFWNRRLSTLPQFLLLIAVAVLLIYSANQGTECIGCSKCPLLEIGGKHWRNMSHSTVETVYFPANVPKSVDNDDFLSRIYRVNSSKIEKIKLLTGTRKACKQVKGRRILMNYADAGCCLNSQKRNCVTGIEMGSFDACLAFTNWSIADSGFVQRNCDLLSQQLWLFKPFLVHHALSSLDDNDILFYSDSGAHFIDSIDDLLCLQHRLDQDVVVFSLNHPEQFYTKPSVFERMGCASSDCRNSPQRLASFILLRKSAKSLKFTAEWLNYAQDPRLLVSDFIPAIATAESYIFPRIVQHRHDQSILSLLSKKWNIRSWPDPSQYGNIGDIERDLKSQGDFMFMQRRMYLLHTRQRD